MGNHMFYMDGTTKAYRNFINLKNTKYDKEVTRAFRDAVAEKLAANEEPLSLNISTENMTMDEYKSYIYDSISRLQMHSSNLQDSVTVHISEDGFAAMKNDPEYEQWVLDCLKRSFGTNDPWSGMYGGKFSIFRFGATKEEYHCESWRKGFQNGKIENLFDRETEEGFWERRARRQKEIQEQYERYLRLNRK